MSVSEPNNIRTVARAAHAVYQHVVVSAVFRDRLETPKYVVDRHNFEDISLFNVYAMISE